MSLDLQSLYKQGAFAGAPVKRDITFKVGGEEITGTVWVRRLSYRSAVDDLKAVEGQEDLVAARIAHCIVDEDGSQLYQKHDVTGVYDDGSPVLDEDGKERGGFVTTLIMALLEAIGEVNGLGKNKG
jgi:hypothetical protein